MALLNNGSASSIIKHLAKDSKCKEAMVNSVQKDVEIEVSRVLRSNGNIFRLADSPDLRNFQWKLLSESLIMKMPVFMNVINSVYPSSKKKSLALIITA